MRRHLVLPVLLLIPAPVQADTHSRIPFLPAFKGKLPKPFPPTPMVPMPTGSGLRVTDRKANTDGEVLILQYHGFSPNEKRYDRSWANFRKDLERVYKLGCRPVTMSEYVENKMPIPPGSSPVVLTFDDSNPTQFKLRPDGSIDPHCGVGIWYSFWKEHPDFPIKGEFYVLPTMMFGQKNLVDQKIKMLQDWGSEIGNHTLDHKPLSKLSEAAAIKEIGGTSAYLAKKGITKVHFCMPYGLFPHDHKLVQQVTYGGKTYHFESNVLCGANPAPSPISKKFNRFRIPRILCNGESDGVNTWLSLAEKGKLNLFVQP